MEQESTKQFNERLAQWVANQGFWFQLRYSMAGGGSSDLMYHTMRLLLRLIIFLAVLAVLSFYYLVKRTEQASFQTDLKENIVRGMDCESGVMKNFNRTQNQATIRYFMLKGGPHSFLDSAEATGISFRVGLLDGLLQNWDVNQITVDRMSLNVKAGAETEEEAAALARSISKRFDSLGFEALECLNTRVSWGYSPRTMGSISQSRMMVTRDDTGWRLRFSGGTFQQNWLKNLRIDELVLLCTSEALIVEKGIFSVIRPDSELAENKLHGKVIFEDVKVLGGLRPMFSGTVIFENLPLYELLQESYHDYVQGSVSGRLKIQGSTNTTDGVSLAGRVSLNEADEIVLRNELPLLNSLSIISPAGSFRKVTFSDGYCHIKTSGGSFHVTEVSLRAPEQMEVRGSFIVRPAKQEEINEMLRKGAITDEVARDASLTFGEIAPTSDHTSMRRTMANAGKNHESAALDTTITDSGQPFAADMLEAENQYKTAEKLAMTAIFDGLVTLTMPSSAFKNAPGIAKMARSMDDTSVVLECPLAGNLYDVTRVQAENLLLIDKKATGETPK